MLFENPTKDAKDKAEETGKNEVKLAACRGAVAVAVVGRNLRWKDGDAEKALDVPVPGAAAMVAFDPFRLVVVLENGET
jgi:hypothetical protein